MYLLSLSVLLFSLLNVKNNFESSKTSQKRFSIVIAFRNEEANLKTLLTSLETLHYPEALFEVVLVNDHSTDASTEIIKQFTSFNKTTKLLHLPEAKSGKKAAIHLGIQHAQFEFILTTDADCLVHQDWLNTYNAYLQENDVAAVIGGVAISKTNRFLEKFQYYDFMALQAVTFAMAKLGQPILCNAANFCYQKKVFHQLDGFVGNENLASGDDVFLLQKMRKAKLKIGYVLQQENLVLTRAETTTKTFIQQRKRWFYKTKQISSVSQKFLSLLLLSTNFSLLFLMIFNFFSTAYFTLFIACLLIKISIDFFLTFELAKKMKLPFCVTDFLIANLFYPVGIVYFFGYLLNSKFTWKQRTYL